MAEGRKKIFKVCVVATVGNRKEGPGMGPLRDGEWSSGPQAGGSSGRATVVTYVNSFSTF